MFLENKYTKWYYSIIDRAKLKNRKKLKRNDLDFVYYESHHIIPKCMGGKEEVLLLPKEHFICHLLLCRMLTGVNKHKMINALIKISYSKSSGQERHVSNSYSLVRSLISEKNSEMFKGVPKSEQTRQRMKGRSGKWIRSEEYKKATSERQKGRTPKWVSLDDNDPKKVEIRRKLSQGRLGENNPCHRQTIESRERIRENLRKKRWFTNGLEDVFSEICPIGFYSGRTKNRKPYARKKKSSPKR